MVEPLDAHRTNSREGGPSFSLMHRLERLIFKMTWAVAETLCPLPFHWLRRSILNLFGANIHRTARVYPGAKIWYPRNLTMAEYSCIAANVNCYNMAAIHLEAYAIVSQGAFLCGGTHDIDDPTFQLIAKPIKIGAGAWVAANAFVGPGSVLGRYAVLGACAVLVGRLEDWQVAVGNPAKVIRKRANIEGQNES